jgi:hypothetical protein
VCMSPLLLLLLWVGCQLARCLPDLSLLWWADPVLRSGQRAQQSGKLAAAALVRVACYMCTGLRWGMGG